MMYFVSIKIDKLHKLMYYFPSFKQALGLQRDDVFSNTMLTTSIEQLVKETTPCIGTRTLDSILFNCEGCFIYLISFHIYFFTTKMV